MGVDELSPQSWLIIDFVPGPGKQDLNIGLK
jgi:hypothetical protein